MEMPRVHWSRGDCAVQLGFGDSFTEFHAYRIESETMPGVWRVIAEGKGDRLSRPVRRLRGEDASLAHIGCLPR